jgi:hypothetical protein
MEDSMIPLECERMHFNKPILSFYLNLAAGSGVAIAE